MARLTWVLAVGGRDDQPVGDLVVGQALADQRDDLALAVGERGQPLGGAAPRSGRLREANSAISRRVTRGDSSASPAGDRPHRPQQVGRLGVLDQEAAGPGAERLEDVLVELEGGQHDHPRCRPGRVGGDPPGRLEPVDARHPDVHQHHVGLQVARTRSTASLRRRRPRRPPRCRARRRAARGTRRAPAPGRRRARPGSRGVRRREARDDPQPAERRRRSRRTSPPQGGRPLAHAPDAVALASSASTSRDAAAVVVDRDDEPAGPVLDGDLGAVGAGVPHHVGDRLLHDPVGRELHARRAAARACR